MVGDGDGVWLWLWLVSFGVCRVRAITFPFSVNRFFRFRFARFRFRQHFASGALSYPIHVQKDMGGKGAREWSVVVVGAVEEETRGRSLDFEGN